MWVSLLIMLACIFGLVGWIVWAMKKDKVKENQ